MCHLSPVFLYWFFCLDDLSLDVRMLKSPHIIVLLLIAPMLHLLTFPLYMGVFFCCMHMYLQLLELLFRLILYLLYSVLLCAYNSLYFFSNICIATAAFLWFPFVWITSFQPLIFSLCISLDLKWVSYRQHTYRSWLSFVVVIVFVWGFFLFLFVVVFCFLSIQLVCLWVEAFSPSFLK